ncbi:MAG: type II toxin-antitoxin system VapC family toxin [Actinomycetota bacterium]
MIVVDTSAVLAVLTGRPRNEDLINRLADDGDLHAPHLIDVEMIHALRRLVSTGDLSQERAIDVRSDFAELSIMRYPHHPLSDRMWELRHAVSAYDAAFVVLAEALGVPLITCDLRLTRASGHQAKIEGFGASR